MSPATPGDAWTATLRHALRERGVSEERTQDLLRDAMDLAAEAKAAPVALFGPAGAYADQLARALRTPGPRLLPEPRAAAALRLSGVSKRYGRREVLRDVSLEVRAGQAVAVVGANGSGKSTLMQICAGLIRPTTGRVERTAHVGYVPQHAGTADHLTPGEHFDLFAAARRDSRRRGAAAGSRLATSLGWRPKDGQTAMRLSGGTRQKLNVILGEINRPDLLLLDEPYQGFDQGAYVDLWSQIDRWRETGTAVLIVTHMLGELHRVDHVVELATPEER